MARNRWFESEFSAVEEDPNSVVPERAEATRVGLDGLDSAVEAFGRGARHAVAEPEQNILKLCFSIRATFLKGSSRDRIAPLYQ